MPLSPAYAGYRAGSLAARLLPGPAVLPASDLLGRVAAQALRPRREQVARHQRRVRPELSGRALDRAVDGVFASYVRYWLESFRLPGTAPADIARGVTAEGFEQVEQALELGNGVILALPHVGGWEWAAFWLTQVRGYQVTAVAEPVDPPELAEWFVGLRRSLGMHIIPLGPSAGTEVVRALKDNHIVCLLCDRDIAGGGIEVDFFGETTTLPGGPATIALRSGVPLIPTATYFGADRDAHHFILRPALDTVRQGGLRADVTRVTGLLADDLEWLIRQDPEQWHLMQPNWPSDTAPAAGPG